MSQDFSDGDDNDILERGDRERGREFSREPDRSSEICRDFQRGHCPRSGHCPFIHKELASGELPPRARREPCRDFLRTGRCPRGARCSYTHQVGGKDVCRDFNRGNCPRGNDCTFAHVLLDGDQQSPRLPPARRVEIEDPRYPPSRKRPRFEFSISPPRTISSSELEHLLSLKTEVASLREDNRYLRDENRALRMQLKEAETRRSERRF